MSKSKEMPNAEFQELVIGEYGPKIIKLCDNYSKLFEYLGTLINERESARSAVAKLGKRIDGPDSAIKSIQEENRRISGSVQNIKSVVSDRNYKVIVRKRTLDEKKMTVVIYCLLGLIVILFLALLR